MGPLPDVIVRLLLKSPPGTMEVSLLLTPYPSSQAPVKSPDASCGASPISSTGL